MIKLAVGGYHKMKCRYCGHEIPDGMLYCEECGKEVRIVPDYNPLDDMLTAQVKGAISGENDYSEDDIYESVRNTTAMGRSTGAGRYTSAGRGTGTGRNGAPGNTAGRSAAGRNTAGRNTSGRRNTSGGSLPERERRRRQAERKKALRRKRRQRALIILAVLAVAVIAACFAIYQTSYAGIVNKGYKAIESKEYDKSAQYFQKAIAKNGKKAEAYAGLAKVYTKQDDLDKAESVFLNAIDKQPKNTDIYEACVQFYMDTDQKAEISLLLEDAQDNVRETLAGYFVKGPKFSLDDSETFEDVQELSLSAGNGCTIYYTTDETDPTVKSTKYAEPIQIGEGETVVSAIAVNKKGIPSLPVKKTYTVELPIEDAPAVSPSTGQYESATQIEIKVPEGYEAYYTMDKSDPTTASTKYVGPIDMPEGETIFKAILVNAKGRTSGVTTRNYVLELSQGE